MPETEGRQEDDGKIEAWHHELGWISNERSEWGWSEEAEAQAQIDIDTAEAFL